MENQNTKFEVGNIYEMSFIGDSNLRPQYICVKRTAKTVTFEKFQNPSDSITRRIKNHDGREYILQGSYSMSPGIYSHRVVG
jgi:hypothetical protein